MPLPDAARALADRIVDRLGEARDFDLHTRQAWRVVQEIAAPHPLIMATRSQASGKLKPIRSAIFKNARKMINILVILPSHPDQDAIRIFIIRASSGGAWASCE